MSKDHPVVTALHQAKVNHETLVIGGKTFTPNNIADFIGHYTAMHNALGVAKDLCANVNSRQHLVDNFGLMVDAI